MSVIFQQIITPEQLFSCLHQPNLIILDASIAPVGNMAAAVKCWPLKCIAKTRRFDLEGCFSNKQSPQPHTMPSAAQFTEQAQLLGVNQDSQIVVYDDQGLFSSARVWWMFKAMGFNNIAVLDGGLPLWCQNHDAVPVNTDEVISPGDFIAQPQAGYFCDYQRVSQCLTDESYSVLDARAAARFFGKMAEPRPGIREGHMPGAINLPFTELLSNGQLSSRVVIKKQFLALTQGNEQLIMTCGSGVTACVLALAADYCGYEDICVYDGSWSEWGQNLALPVTCD